MIHVILHMFQSVLYYMIIIYSLLSSIFSVGSFLLFSSSIFLNVSGSEDEESLDSSVLWLVAGLSSAEFWCALVRASFASFSLSPSVSSLCVLQRQAASRSAQMVGDEGSKPGELV